MRKHETRQELRVIVLKFEAKSFMEDRVSPFFTINIKNNWFVRLDDRRAKIENFSDGKTFGDKMLVEKLTLDFGYKQLSIMSKTNVKNSML